MGHQRNHLRALSTNPFGEYLISKFAVPQLPPALFVDSLKINNSRCSALRQTESRSIFWHSRLLLLRKARACLYDNGAQRIQCLHLPRVVPHRRTSRAARQNCKDRFTHFKLSNHLIRQSHCKQISDCHIYWGPFKKQYSVGRNDGAFDGVYQVESSSLWDRNT
jgi:hypothetical protein